MKIKIRSSYSNKTSDAEIIKQSKNSVTVKLLQDYEVYSTGEIITINKKYQVKQ